MPVSTILMLIFGDSASLVNSVMMLTLPRSVNLIALPTRFVTI